MTSPLVVTGGPAGGGWATGRGSKGGLLSGRNRLFAQDLDRKLIGARDRLRFEPPELGLEGRQVLDRAVDRREHDGRDAVQAGESTEGQLADPLGRRLAAAAADGGLDRVDQVVQPFGVDRALGGRALEAAQELLAV